MSIKFSILLIGRDGSRIDGINAEADYDAATSGYQDENTLNDELSYYDEQVLVYQQAINSLAKLLPERISNVSTTIAP